MEDVTKLNLDAYGEDFIPQGFFIINGDDVFPTRIRNRIIINLKDLIHSRYHQDISRLNVVAEKMDVTEITLSVKTITKLEQKRQIAGNPILLL